MADRAASLQRNLPSASASRRSTVLARAFICALLGVLTLIGSFLIGGTGEGMWIIGGALAILLALLIFIQPELGAYTLVAFVYLNLSDVAKSAANVPSMIRPLILLILVSVLANRVLLQRKPIVFRGLELSILVYGIVTIFSSFAATDKALANDQIAEWVKNYAILLIIVQLCSQERVFKHAQWVLILSAALLGLLSTYQVLTGNYSNEFFGLAKAPVHQITVGNDSNRLTGPLDDPNFYAQMLLMVVPLAAYRALTAASRQRRLVGMICVALIVFAAVFTYSRAAFISLAIVGALMVYDLKIKPAKIVAFLLIVFLVVIPFLPANYINRLMTLEDVGSNQTTSTDQSLVGRSSELIIAIQMFLDHPIIGIGVGNYSAHYQDYSDRLGVDQRNTSREAHNYYAEIAAEKGSIGLIVFFIMIFMLFRSIRRAKRQLADIGRTDLLPWVSAVQYGFISYLYTSLFLHDSYSRYFWLIVAFVAAASAMTEALVLRNNQKLEEGKHDFYFTYLKESTE